jgi:hypothetical protein
METNKSPNSSQSKGLLVSSRDVQPIMQEANKPARTFRWEVALRHHQEINGLTAKPNIPINVDASRMLFYFKMEMGDTPHGIKKNGRQIAFNSKLNRPILGKSGDLVRAEKSLIAALRLQAQQQRVTKPFEGRLHLIALFYFPRSKYYTAAGEISETLPDMSNLLELPQDCMQSEKLCKTGKRKGPDPEARGRGHRQRQPHRLIRRLTSHSC